VTGRTPAPRAAASTVLQVDWRQFSIIDVPRSADAVWPVPSDWSNGLVSVEATGAVVFTGIKSGAINVTAEAHDREPAAELEAWDEVIEFTLTSTAGWLRVLEEVPGDQFKLPNLSPHGPGAYRLRCHARGRDIAYDGSAIEPVEDYLIQAWRSPPASVTVIKQTDACGANLRLSATLSSAHGEAGPGVDGELVVPQRARSHSRAEDHPIRRHPRRDGSRRL
jgi:hypothetical protein